MKSHVAALLTLAGVLSVMGASKTTPVFGHDLRLHGGSSLQVTVQALISTRIELIDPKGRSAVIRGNEASSDISGCDLTPGPTGISGDCMLFVGNGSRFLVREPSVGDWKLRLIQRGGKYCRGVPTRVRLEAVGSSDVLAGAFNLAEYDSVRLVLHVGRNRVRVDRE